MILCLFHPLFVGFFADPFQGSAAKAASIGRKTHHNQIKIKLLNSFYEFEKESHEAYHS